VAEQLRACERAETEEQERRISVDAIEYERRTQSERRSKRGSYKRLPERKKKSWLVHLDVKSGASTCELASIW